MKSVVFGDGGGSTTVKKTDSRAKALKFGS